MQIYVYIFQQYIIFMVDGNILCKDNSKVIMKDASE